MAEQDGASEPARLKMSLRQRHIRRGFRSADAEGAAAAGPNQGAALATVAVGLKHGEMTKLERQLFGSRMKDYLKSRYHYSAHLMVQSPLYIQQYLQSAPCVPAVGLLQLKMCCELDDIACAVVVLQGQDSCQVV